MPFIFHSKKQSIFDSKAQNIVQNQPEAFQVEEKSNEIQMPNQRGSLLCKEHPFRKFIQIKDRSIDFKSQSQSKFSRSPNHSSQSLKKQNLRPLKSNTFETDAKRNGDQITSKTEKLHLIPESLISVAIIHQSKDIAKMSNNKNIKQSVVKLIRQNTNQNDERLKFLVSDTPGPGSYNVTTKKREKSPVFYQSQTINHPLPPKDETLLEYSQVSKQQKNPQFQQRSFLLDCNYKSQVSPSFRSSILNRLVMKKNGTLLSMLFSGKGQKNKQVQCQTTCSSNMAETRTIQFFSEEFVKDESHSPSPFTYNIKTDFLDSKDDKKSKVFVSGSSKLYSYVPQNTTPGPGSYNEKIAQSNSIFNQNQNKRPNKFEEYDTEPQKLFGFSSAVPRELHFDNEMLCRQQLYYSPKNNLNDLVSMKENKSNRSNKFFFGSSLQRFEKDQIISSDPYKYCFSKNKLAKNDALCPSLSFKEKRQLFGSIQNNVPPNKYHDYTNTIYKQTQKQIFKKLLQSKYQDQVLLMKEKKQNMQKLLIEEKNKIIDIKNIQKASEQINPDNYKEYLVNKKRKEKQSIAFGYNKGSTINRAFEPRKQIDLYYNTEPSWDIKSFNKGYGHEIEQY